VNRGALRPSEMSRNSNPNLFSRVDSTAWSRLPAVPNPPNLIQIAQLFQTFPPKFLRDAATSKSGGTTLLMDRVSRSSVSMSSIPLIRADLVLESLCSAVNCRVHVGRVLDIDSRTSGNE